MMTTCVREEILIPLATGSLVAWSKLGAVMNISGSCMVTGVALSSDTSSTKPLASNVNGAPRRRSASSGSAKEDRVARL